jgi:hypothetical protein
MTVQFNRFSTLWMGVLLVLLLLQVASGKTPVENDGDQAIAVLIKVINPVNVRRADREEPLSAEIDQYLYPGDRVICGDGGYATILFLDDAAELKMLPETDLTLQGKRTETGIVKRVFLDVGKLLTRVLGGELEVVTPTSVASVKGTLWWTLVDAVSGTRVLVEEGEVRVLSRMMGASAVVEAGNSVLNTISGEMIVQPFDPSSLPAESPPSDTGSLEIEFKDNQGEKKVLHIKFKRE